MTASPSTSAILTVSKVNVTGSFISLSHPYKQIALSPQTGEPHCVAIAPFNHQNTENLTIYGFKLIHVFIGDMSIIDFELINIQCPQQKTFFALRVHLSKHGLPVGLTTPNTNHISE